MEIVCIDIETTGLNPNTHSLIQFGAVYAENWDAVPQQLLLNFSLNDLVWNDYCLTLHKDLIADKSQTRHFVSELAPLFNEWLLKVRKGKTDKVTVAGKNFLAFDAKFLPNVMLDKFHRRALDPVHYFIEPNDTCPPDLQTCLNRAGFTTNVKHTADEDAMDVFRLLRYAHQKGKL